MSFVEIIARKRDRLKLRPEEIARFVDGATTGDVPPEQLAALLMAICIHGMDGDETADLTREMLESGEAWRLAGEVPEAVDKHSTGGVGDTVSLIFAPLMAAVGQPVAMMAGRGLGHSQGTLDKLESIPGFKVDWDRAGMLRLLDLCGAAVVAQTAEIAPADRTLYALRDVTGTVPSLPLIVGSIMSKKLALGAGTLILDVKCGSGAFRKTLPDAVELARALRDVARAAGVACEALITEMDQPLGSALGNACEVRAAVDVLSGKGSVALREISLRLAEEALVLRGRNRATARQSLEEALDNGAALGAWRDFVMAHGGDPDPTLLAEPERVIDVIAARQGTISAIDGEVLGRAAVVVGAGRRWRDDAIDNAAGIEVDVRLGDVVARNDVIARILVGKRPVDVQDLVARVESAISIQDDGPEPPPLVYGRPEDIEG